eukprot:TRINITY_DN2894_c0_g3_i1.p1 TRINITY_DN2894_c0_g3~~TRINITY_DN2894_c0_g3_i1.p1  ORF type:complete len:126 (+),score=16.76 TRINITY_DN2894_c0_g3_i1:41-418(+)
MERSGARKPYFESEIRSFLEIYLERDAPAETVEVLDEYLQNYLTALVNKAHKRSQRRDTTASRVYKEDMLHFLRHDSKKYIRTADMLNKNKAFKQYQSLERFKAGGDRDLGNQINFIQFNEKSIP